MVIVVKGWDSNGFHQKSQQARENLGYFGGAVGAVERGRRQHKRGKDLPSTRSRWNGQKVFYWADRGKMIILRESQKIHRNFYPTSRHINGAALCRRCHNSWLESLSVS
jgi:hypothetical protein